MTDSIVCDRILRAKKCPEYNRYPFFKLSVKMAEILYLEGQFELAGQRLDSAENQIEAQKLWPRMFRACNDMRVGTNSVFAGKVYTARHAFTNRRLEECFLILEEIGC